MTAAGHFRAGLGFGRAAALIAPESPTITSCSVRLDILAAKKAAGNSTLPLGFAGR